MELRPGISIDEETLRRFARRHGIRRIAAFGSVLRDDFHAESDVDLLVEFEEDRIPGLLALAAMELELGEEFGREIELRTYQDLSRFFRDEVRNKAVDLYAA